MKLRRISTYFAEPSLQECESLKSWQNLDRKVKVEMENDERIKTQNLTALQIAKGKNHRLEERKNTSIIFFQHDHQLKKI